MKSLEEVHGSVKTEYGSYIRRFFAFLGPAYLVSVGYMDPGNWATDLEGGSRFGFELVWVLLLANLMALLLQTLSARLGVVAGRDLAQASREQYSKVTSFVLWLFAEVAIAACDLAEIIGTIIGLHLLFGISLEMGVVLTAFSTFLLLLIQRLGMRKMELFIVLLVATIGFCFVLQMVLASPAVMDILGGAFPRITSQAPYLFSEWEALYIALGILGATVMPHNLYLHSALVQTRILDRSKEGLKRACKYNFFDSLIALNMAFFINLSILVLAATAFYASGVVVADIEEAHRLLPQFLGASIASTLFAVALLASGQSSTITGTIAGQIVMEGFIRLRISPIARRILTRMVALVPAATAVYLSGGEHLTALLVLSQVVLSLQLPFAIIPLVYFTSDRKRMGEFANGVVIKVLAGLATVIVVSLNAMLAFGTVREWYAEGYLGGMAGIAVAGVLLLYGVMLVVVVGQPLVTSLKQSVKQTMGVPPEEVGALVAGAKEVRFGRVGIAVENCAEDSVAIRHGLHLARVHGAEVCIVHVVDGAAGQVFGRVAADEEARVDSAYVERVAAEMVRAGVQARGVLRYGRTVAGIVSAVEEEGVDVLVLRSHGHGWVMDRVLGATIDAVRHKVRIPVVAVWE